MSEFWDGFCVAVAIIFFCGIFLMVSSVDFELLQEIKGEGSHTNPLYRLGERLGYYSKEKAIKICDSFETTAIFQMGISECVNKPMQEPQPVFDVVCKGSICASWEDRNALSKVWVSQQGTLQREEAK